MQYAMQFRPTEFAKWLPAKNEEVKKAVPFLTIIFFFFKPKAKTRKKYNFA